jgi:NAD(P)-dependent dehydrogenase (short-subunit alcohol dehydrogenase family)
MLGQEGYGLTVNSRRPEKIEAAGEELRAAGYEVEVVPGSVADEAVVQEVVRRHRERYGRLDVLVNNAGVGAGQPIAEMTTKMLDLQLGANLRHIPLFYRESLDLLKAAAAEHKNAVVINTSSISGKRGEAWLSVYSATKHGVVGFTEAMNKELGPIGIKSTALCPAFVDTPMTDFVKGAVPIDKMIMTSDVAEMVRPLLKLSPGCTIPEILFEQTGFEIGQTL